MLICKSDSVGDSFDTYKQAFWKEGSSGLEFELWESTFARIPRSRRMEILSSRWSNREFSQRVTGAMLRWNAGKMHIVNQCRPAASCTNFFMWMHIFRFSIQAIKIERPDKKITGKNTLLPGYHERFGGVPSQHSCIVRTPYKDVSGPRGADWCDQMIVLIT